MRQNVKNSGAFVKIGLKKYIFDVYYNNGGRKTSAVII